MLTDTAQNIINKAAVRLGLIATGPASFTDPYDSTDPSLVILCSLFEEMGQTLVRDFAWQHLQKTHTFNTGSGTASYALPADFARIVDQTAWNRTQDKPLIGPITPQEWQYVQAVGSTVTANQLFRIFGNLFYIFSTPTATESVAYEYVSSYWVDLTGNGTTPDSASPTDGTDVVYFDPLLSIQGLELAYLRAKGFDTTVAQAKFDGTWKALTSADGAAPVLSVTRRPFGSHRLLDESNLPETGYGS